MIIEYRRLFPEHYEKELFIGDQLSDQLCAESLQIPFIRVRDSQSEYNQITSILAG